MLIRELLELTLQDGQNISKIAKDRMPFGEKKLKDALTSAQCEPIGKGKKGWHFIGDDESILDKNIEDFGSVRKAQQKQRQKHNASTSESTNKSIIESNKNSENKIDSDSKLDYLLKHDKKQDNLYRGFYLSSEVVKALDKVPSGNKSELVDELLKRFFREKGLL